MSDWTGVLHLDAEDRKGKTVAKKVYYQGAFKVMRPIYHDNSGQACYYLLNPGGGYLDGDSYQMKISLAENARMTLTTQGATKVYKTPNKYAYQESDISLKAGSYLEYIPDPLIAYQNARYKQKNVIRMDQTATFLYSDILTPGWSPEGERFSYTTVQLLNEIYMDDELVVFDHIKLQPSEQNIRGLGFMEGYSHLGSMIVVSEQSNSSFLDQLYSTLSKSTYECKVGLSLLSVPGFTIRVLANSTQMIEKIFSEIHQMISREWFQIIPSSLRKY
ncbi:urease accessory protein UreD [Neobacillus bataviensis LMG 21833]|uniref:Urease accessory protein UreD n=1 Tax=Neobacillus bataviensis LMG 21833 TaxID=1117379 RepID=K6DR39_9BACI|nr:urease accessory protein UreD [Neobacillus bataviensis]EKN70673.1 urease accessory protein UreD [Neobacillus bataviensis LMG 21833]